MKDNLEGQVITIFTDGGWQAHGEVKLDQKDRMGLEAPDGAIFIILKAKISMIRMEAGMKSFKDSQDQPSSSGYNLPISRTAGRPKELSHGYSSTEQNNLGQGNQYGSILPSDMLEEIEESHVTDFSASFNTPSEGRIEVKIDSKEEA